MQVASAANDLSYTVQITYTFENRSNETYSLPDSYLTMFDFQSDQHQMITTVESSHTVSEYITDDDGNVFNLLGAPRDIPAFGNTSIYVHYSIQSSDRPRPEIDSEAAANIADIPVSLVDEYCLETETFNWSGRVEVLAGEIMDIEDSVLEQVISAVEWIMENVDYTNFDTPLYPIETIEDGKGDCDDQAILLISMLRSMGIPAYLQVGMVLDSRITGEDTVWGGHMMAKQDGVGWHGWAMVYVPPWGWIPVDLTLVPPGDASNAIYEAPEYYSFIITAYNVSRQAYIAEGRSERSDIMSGNLYITIEDIGYFAKDNGFGDQTMIILGLGTAAALCIIYLFISTRNS